MIHLLNKRRFKTLPWAATSFLFKASKSSNKKHKLKQWVILSLRCLTVAAIVLLAARPFTHTSLIDNDLHKEGVITILIDCSPSMRQIDPNTGLSKLDSAIRLARSNVDLLDPQKIILIDSVTLTPHLLSSGLELLNHWTLKKNDKEANIPKMFDVALDYISENTSGRVEIWVLSDLQASAWQIENSMWSQQIDAMNTLRNRLQLKLIPFEEEDVNKVEIEVNYVKKENDCVTVTSTVYQSAINQRESVPVRYWIDGDSYNFDIPLLGTRTEFTKEFPSSNNSGFGYGEVADASSSSLARSYFTYQELETRLSLVVSTDDESQRYLMASVRAGNMDDTERVKSFKPQQLLPLSNAQLLIWQAPLPIGSQAERVENFIHKGGVALFLPPIKNSSNVFLSSKWGDTIDATDSDTFRITDYNRDDGPLRDGNDGVAIPMHKIECIKYRKMDTAATKLAQWGSRDSALSRQMYGKGHLYYCSTLANYFWSSLANGDVLLPLIKRLSDQAKNPSSETHSLVVGSVEATDIINNNKCSIILPDQYKSTDNLLVAGVISYEEKRFAQNRDPRELQSSVLATSEILDMLPSASFADNSQEMPPRPIWQIFGYLTLAFLIGESLLTASIPLFGSNNLRSKI